MSRDLSVVDLAVERGGRLLFEGLSFTVASGEALLLTGPNGAGKTSLLRVLAGFLQPAAGEVRLQGGEADRSLGEQCHWLGHANAVKPALTVAENAAFWASYLGGGEPGRRAVGDALDRFGLTELADIPAGYLSAGQKRRLGLARLLLAPRPLWLLDEPTVSLDAEGTATLAAVIDAHLASGGLAVAATHLPMGLARARQLQLGGTPGAQPASAT